VGKGMGRAYLRRRADSEKLYRHTAGNERSGGGLETSRKTELDSVQCVLFVYRLRTE